MGRQELDDAAGGLVLDDGSHLEPGDTVSDMNHNIVLPERILKHEQINVNLGSNMPSLRQGCWSPGFWRSLFGADGTLQLLCRQNCFLRSTTNQKGSRQTTSTPMACVLMKSIDRLFDGWSDGQVLVRSDGRYQLIFRGVFGQRTSLFRSHGLVEKCLMLKSRFKVELVLKCSDNC